MDNEAAEYYREHANVRLHNIREHAQIIRTMLESPGSETSNLRLWRALYVVGIEVVAATIAHMPGTQTNTIVQRRFGAGIHANQSSREGFTDPYVTPEEMAVFLGLGEVDPANIHWTEQSTGGKKIIAVRDPGSMGRLH